MSGDTGNTSNRQHVCIGKLSIFLSAESNVEGINRQTIIARLPMYRSSRLCIYPHVIHDIIVDTRELNQFYFDVVNVKPVEDALRRAVYAENPATMDPYLAIEWARGTIPPLPTPSQHRTRYDEHRMYILDIDVYIFKDSFKRVYHYKHVSSLMDLLLRSGNNRVSSRTERQYQCVKQYIARLNGLSYSTNYVSSNKILRNVGMKTQNYNEYESQPPGLNVTMRPYQRKNLAYMLSVERREENMLWLLIEWEDGDNNRERVYYSPYFIMFRTDCPPPIRGGILGDEMGLGKTISSLALILANNTRENDDGGTLVCCPVSLCGQWVNECIRRLNVNLNVYMYHGGKRIRDPAKLRQFDIIVTTYGIVASDSSFGRRKARINGIRDYVPPLEQINFHRIIFDESHTAKNTNTSLFKGCCKLKGRYKWCVTGTPIAMDPFDLYGQLRLIDNEEYKYLVRSRYSYQHFTALSVDAMIRHHKRMIVNGLPILDLPECTEEDVILHLSDKAWGTYTTVKQSIVARINSYHRGVEIMYNLEILRRLCSSGFTDSALHTFDILPDRERRERIMNGLIGETCCVCLEGYDDPVVTPCNHTFCSECVSQIFSTSTMWDRCPLCRTNISPSTVYRLEEPIATCSESPKIEKLLQLVRAAPFEDKFIVFTQFKSTLRRIQNTLSNANISSRSISGSMSRAKRVKNLEEFETMDTVRVFVLSLRSGAVGINLTSANHVVLMEPTFNPAMERQAIGRAYRLGQSRPVTVHRLVAENTIDRHIIETRKTFYNDISPHTSSDRSARLWSTGRLRQLLND